MSVDSTIYEGSDESKSKTGSTDSHGSTRYSSSTASSGHSARSRTSVQSGHSVHGVHSAVAQSTSVAADNWNPAGPATQLSSRVSVTDDFAAAVCGAAVVEVHILYVCNKG